MRRTPYFTARYLPLINTFSHVFKSNDQAQPGRKGMPEEQSVRAREGAADPHGCGNPLRSGIPFLT
jgi:hypothetical protein